MAEDTPKKQFEVRLFQQARVNTETFTVEAADESEALAIAKTDHLTGKDLPEGYDLEVHDVTPPTPPAAAADVPEEDKALAEQGDVPGVNREQE